MHRSRALPQGLAIPGTPLECPPYSELREEMVLEWGALLSRDRGLRFHTAAVFPASFWS